MNVFDLNGSIEDTASQVTKPIEVNRLPGRRLTGQRLVLFGGAIGVLALSLVLFIGSRSDKGESARQDDVPQLQVIDEIADITIAPGDARSFISTNFKGSIAFSPGFVWVANGHGLLSYDVAAKSYRVYTESDGLFSTNTTEAEYFDGSVWVVSQENGVNHAGGISRYHIEEGRWETYSAVDFGIGRLLQAELNGGGRQLALTTRADGGMYQLAVFDEDSGQWNIKPGEVAREEVPYTSDAWRTAKSFLSSKLRAEVSRLETKYCAHEEFGGTRQDQLLRNPITRGIARNGGEIWYGCLQGFIVINEDTETVQFLGPADDYPVLIYEILTAKQGRLFVQTNLGLGIYEPATGGWEKVRSPLQSYNHADFDWWNSAVWIDDKIYFLEFRYENPSTISERVVSLWLYETRDKYLRDVTPDPQSTLQDAYYILPFVLRPTSDGKSVQFQSGQQTIFTFTPSTPNPKVVLFDFETESTGVLAEKYWGYGEHDGILWYLTDAFLGKVSDNNMIEKIQLPKEYKGATKHCITVTDTQVILNSGDLSDAVLYSYDIESGKWTNNLLVNSSSIRSLSCSQDRLFVPEGRFKNMLLSDSFSETVTAVDPSEGDLVGVEVSPSRLLAISLETGLANNLGSTLVLPEKEVSRLVYDGEAIWIRHSLTGLTRVDNAL